MDGAIQVCARVLCLPSFVLSSAGVEWHACAAQAGERAAWEVATACRRECQLELLIEVPDVEVGLHGGAVAVPCLQIPVPRVG